MQTHFNVKLKEGLTAWPLFVELCERRNLLTHTGGIVSDQYLKVCREHKCSVGGVRVGQQLSVNPEYFTTAVETVYEIGLKLCYVLWRKFDEKTKADADSELNARCMELITARRYRLAEALLSFSHGVRGLTDQIRRMMIVNLANAIRLQDRVDEAKRILDTEDWSATNDDFQVCVASVKGDIDTVLRIMQSMGGRFDADRYRTWPVFHRTRNDARFVEKFESIFEEPFVVIKRENALSLKESADTALDSADTALDAESTKTMH
jgi:hypothetical protein